MFANFCCTVMCLGVLASATAVGGASYKVVKLDKHTRLNVVGDTDVSVTRMKNSWYVISGNQTFEVPKDTRVRKMAAFMLPWVKDHTLAYRKAQDLVTGTKYSTSLACMSIAESGGDSTAISPKGAQGMLQVMPECKRYPGFGFYQARYAYLNDSLNIRAADLIYREKLRSVRGNPELARERYCGQGPEARAYSARVNRLIQRYYSTPTPVISYTIYS